jgi:hypothetical protein
MWAWWREKGDDVGVRFAHPNLCGLAFLLLVTLCASMATKGEEQDILFRHGDWEISCDNTLTCRMAGYCAEETYEDGCGSVLITRAAGPGAPLEGKVSLADYGRDEGYEPPRFLTLRVGGRSKGKLEYRKKEETYPLTQVQTRALLAAARKDTAILFEGEGDSFTLSGKGVSAVLLKADEVQGRIGTPGALIRKGDKPEENVFPPRPMPVIRAAKVSDTPSRALTAPEVAALNPLLWQNEEVKENCHDFNEFTLTPLDERHVLISMLCWRAAYNEGNAYWVMDSALAGIPKFVTAAADFYSEGKIFGSFKERGPGDCYSGSNWIWDGQAFHLSETWTTGMCRGIRLGGTWRLPTFVSKVVNEDGTPR